MHNISCWTCRYYYGTISTDNTWPACSLPHHWQIAKVCAGPCILSHSLGIIYFAFIHLFICLFIGITFTFILVLKFTDLFYTSYSFIANSDMEERSRPSFFASFCYLLHFSAPFCASMLQNPFGFDRLIAAVEIDLSPEDRYFAHWGSKQNHVC